MSRIECGKYKCLKEGTQLCGRRTPGEPESCICKDGYIGDECVDKTCPGTPIPCSGHGVCNGTKCKCDPNWYGAACEIYCDRNGTCSGHGTCGGSPGIHRNVPEDRLGTCYCDQPWFGETCNQKPVDPPNACEAMGNCGEPGRGMGGPVKYRPFVGENIINWRDVPPSSECYCDCKDGYYRDVKDPDDHNYSMPWHWGEQNPFHPEQIAPTMGLSITGISTNKGSDGKCLPCPPGYYVHTVGPGGEGSGTNWLPHGTKVCKLCSCPTKSADNGHTTQQSFVNKLNNSRLRKDQLCSGSGTSPTGDPDLVASLTATCIPDEQWCDDHHCYVKKSKSTCSIANRNCPAKYTDKGTSDNMCFPGWSVRHCLYEQT